MKKYKILKSRPYRDFTNNQGIRPGQKAKRLIVGDVVEFPEDYGNGLVEHGLAEAYKNPLQKVVSGISDLIKSKEKETQSEIDATPAAKNLADDHSVSLQDVLDNMDKKGRIVKSDVNDYIEANKTGWNT